MVAFCPATHNGCGGAVVTAMLRTDADMIVSSYISTYIVYAECRCTFGTDVGRHMIGIMLTGPSTQIPDIMGVLDAATTSLST
jgi:hypothetical protein